MGFEPRDGVEYILAAMVFAHFSLILDSMRDVFQGQTEAMKLRTKSGVVALDRAMIGMIQQMRTERRRPMSMERAREAPAAEAPPPVVQPPAPQPAPQAAQPAPAQPAPQPAPARPAQTGPLPGLPTKPEPDILAAALAPPARPGPLAAAMASTSLSSGDSVLTRALLHPGEHNPTLRQHIADFERDLAAAQQLLAENPPPVPRKAVVAGE
jgi:hypothetical protein